MTTNPMPATDHEPSRSILRVVTHPARFHADEVFACVIVEHAFDRIEIDRTDDPGKIQEADVVLDVGGRYDPAAWRLDHHMTPPPVIHPEGVPMAAAGMAWNEFGMQVVRRFCPELKEWEQRAVCEILRKETILGIDAWDNGIFPRRDEIRHTGLSQLVAEVSACDETGSGFGLAMDLMRGVLRVKLRSLSIGFRKNREANAAWESGLVEILEFGHLRGTPQVVVFAPEVESISIDWAMAKLSCLPGLERAFIAGMVTRCSSGRGGRFWLRTRDPLPDGAEETVGSLRFLHQSRRFASFDHADDGLRLLAHGKESQKGTIALTPSSP